MNNFLSRNINTIFIMLGHECNLQCKYCVQHEIVNVALEKEINPNLYNFILEIARQQMDRVNVQFYGGEPLVFWNKIKEIVLRINDLGKPNNLNFVMISNGKLLDEEKVDFINEHFSAYTVSWDGRNSKITRGYDVFKDNKENVLKLNNLAVSGVLSAYNYIKDFLEDCESINQEYTQKHNGKTIGINVDDLLDVNLAKQDLKNIDFDKCYNQIHDVCDEYKMFFKYKKNISFIKQLYLEQKMNLVKCALKNNDIKPKRDKCGNGYEIINVDLQGNLYKCHNTNQFVGTIMDSIFDVIQNVLELDKTKQNSIICNDCSVQILCRNGCPLVSKEAREEYYCTAIKLLNYPILELVMDIKS